MTNLSNFLIYSHLWTRASQSSSRSTARPADQRYNGNDLGGPCAPMRAAASPSREHVRLRRRSAGIEIAKIILAILE